MQKPKKILITGACGYIGSVLVELLGQKLDGYIIRLFDNLNNGSINGIFNLPLNGHYQFIEGNLLDPNQLNYALKGIDTVIHLAAIVNTPLSFDNPDLTKQVNQWGTTHLVDACLKNKVEHIIFASTSSVYGPGKNKSESASPDPLGAYSSSKLDAENYIKAKSGDFTYTILRIGTVYGPSPSMRIKSFVNRLCFLAGTKKKLTVYGDGKQVRPVIHINDLCNLFLKVLISTDLFRNKTLNVCEGNYTIIEVIKAIQKNRGDVDVVYTDQDIRTRYDFSIANKKITDLGWHPEINIEEGVRSVLNQFEGFERVNSSNYNLQ